jgi:hypothetical protein
MTIYNNNGHEPQGEQTMKTDKRAYLRETLGRHVRRKIERAVFAKEQNALGEYA